MDAGRAPFQPIVFQTADQMQKIRINGLKLSSELVRLHLTISEKGKSYLSDICRLLNHHKINILFMTVAEESEQTYGLCCVDANKRCDVENVIKNEPYSKTSVRIFPGAGLLTLFPHQSRLGMVGFVLQKLGDNQIPVYGMASSIAAITFVTDYNRLDDGARVLTNCLELPEKATPTKSTLKVQQIDSNS